MRRIAILTELYWRAYWPLYLVALVWVLGVQLIPKT